MTFWYENFINCRGRLRHIKKIERIIAMTNLELQKEAVKVRKGIIDGVHAAKAGHPGGSLSAAEVFTYLYFEEMNIDPKDPKKPDRDRFVLSKGHTAPGLYAALANRGYFPVEDLLTLRHIGSIYRDTHVFSTRRELTLPADHSDREFLLL